MQNQQTSRVADLILSYRTEGSAIANGLIGNFREVKKEVHEISKCLEDLDLESAGFYIKKYFSLKDKFREHKQKKDERFARGIEIGKLNSEGKKFQLIELMYPVAADGTLNIGYPYTPGMAMTLTPIAEETPPSPPYVEVRSNLHIIRFNYPLCSGFGLDLKINSDETSLNTANDIIRLSSYNADRLNQYLVSVSPQQMENLEKTTGSLVADLPDLKQKATDVLRVKITEPKGENLFSFSEFVEHGKDAFMEAVSLELKRMIS